MWTAWTWIHRFRCKRKLRFWEQLQVVGASFFNRDLICLIKFEGVFMYNVDLDAEFEKHMQVFVNLAVHIHFLVHLSHFMGWRPLWCVVR